MYQRNLKTLLAAILCVLLQFSLGCNQQYDDQPLAKGPTQQTTTGLENTLSTSESQNLSHEEKDPLEPTNNDSLQEPDSQEPKNPASENGNSSSNNTDENKEKKFFPELFEGWEKPTFSLMITGRQHGYVEPCGCTGLDNQKGGLNRRFTLLKELKQRGWDVVALDAGNQVRRFGRQPEIKFQITSSGLQKMDYQAVTFGPDDLRLSVGEIFAGIVGNDPEDIRFVSANVSLFGATPKFRIFEIAGKKIGVTGVLGESHRNKITNDEVIISDPIEGLTATWEELDNAKCDLYVLLSHASLEESREYAQKFPGFQLIVTTGGAGEPTRLPEEIEQTGARMIQVGTKGMYAGVIGVYGEEQLSIRYQRVPLDARFKDNDEMLKLLAEYQQQLESLKLEGLEVQAIPHSSGLKFVGSQACQDCHSEEYDIWQETPHGHATQTLITPPERYQVSRHHDPECLACHVVGWDQQNYVPYTSGYWNLEQSPLKRGVGCENCHGPGAAHVAAENGENDPDEKLLETLRKQMQLPLNLAEETCLKCHDLDNSPDFHVKGAFEAYWKKIEH